MGCSAGKKVCMPEKKEEKRVPAPEEIKEPVELNHRDLKQLVEVKTEMLFFSLHKSLFLNKNREKDQS